MSYDSGADPSTNDLAPVDALVAANWNGRATEIAGNGSKITTANGRVLLNGQPYRGVFINAHDQLADVFATRIAVTGITQANPGVLTFGAAHGLAVGNPVLAENIGGMTQLSGLYFVNTVPTTTTLTLRDAAGTPINTSAFSAWTSGGTISRAWYTQDLAAIAASGVRLIRVSMGPLSSQPQWTAQVGTNGATPVSTFLPTVRAFLDAAQQANLGVILVLYWSHTHIPLVLSGTQADYATAGGTLRTYLRTMAATVARNFKDHPALAAYHVGNEWYDYAQTARFLTTTADTAQDHFGALIGTINDIVDGIRTWDNDRAILSPSGSGGRFEAGNPTHYLRKFIAGAGRCDVIDYHLYPDTDRSGFAHAFVGRAPDLGGCDIFLPLLRHAALQAGKALMVTECAADDDHTSYGSASTGALSRTSWDKCFAAGVDMVGDWGWYADPTLYAASVPNLKLIRNSVMSQIAAYNPTLAAGYIAPPVPYPAPGRYPLPSRCARGLGVANSWVRIPNNPDLSIDTVSTARMTWMFWLRRRAVLPVAARLVANNDGTNGLLLTSSAAEGLSAQMFWGGASFTFTGSGNFLAYPADMPTDPTISYPGEWVHVCVDWDGTPTATPQDDGLQHMTFRVDGLVIFRNSYTGRVPSAASTRDLYLMASSDGASNFAAVDIFDFMMGKTRVSDQDLANYIRFGTVPPGIQHRWRLSGDTLDSIGTLHAVAGSQLQFVANGIGNQS